ncbi:uncharacterized protein [Nicotiana sylvestris]|uniref:uncharacterized protein n=1 Tax=Nicotiana sylvestris TaxID=4096 RepID=UPI00388C9A99
MDTDYVAWFEKRSCANNEPEPEPESPTKRPHIQAFDNKVQEILAWGEKEKKYQAAIHTLDQKLRNMEFNNDLQEQEVEGERRRLVKENEALQVQIRKMKIAAENPVKSEKEKKLIEKLKLKVHDNGFELEKTEAELGKARAELDKSMEGWASFVRQLKEMYGKGIVGLKKKVDVLENQMTNQARDFKVEREHGYALMSQLEKNLQQFEEKNYTIEQVLEDRSQQIGRLLQEKGIIRERVRRIADYIVMKCNKCKDMTLSMFFASVMIFVRQIMDELFCLQEDMAHMPATRPTGATVEALMYS